MQGTILHILQDPRLDLDIESSSGLVVSRIRQYLQLFLKWNQKINFTAEKDPEEILKKHVFDSLQYSRAFEPGCRVMDIGSGAGFPGIPLKIIFPELQLVLVESQRKRCSFLETVVRDLEMEQVKVFNARAEDISGNQAGQFDVVVFRAVSGAQECLNLSDRFLPSGGRVVLKKNPGENLKQMVSDPRFLLQKEVSITSYHGVISSLLVFEKCST